MKTRSVTLFTGRKFSVPQCIQRLDHKAMHGWQLRYGGTKLFSDHSPDGRGARASLARATEELLARIARLPAPTMLQREPNRGKTSALPVGISGPIVRLRAGSQVRSASLSVSLPRFGLTSRRRSVYIGTENTYTLERYEAALAKAVKMRAAAEIQYRRAATLARRAQAEALQRKHARRAAARR